MKSLTFGIALMLFSLSTQALDHNYKIELPIKDAALFQLSDIRAVEKKIKSKVVNELGMGESVSDEVNVSRVYVSDWFNIDIQGKSYITNDNADYWMESGSDNLFVLNGGANKISTSNDVLESLVDFTGFINFSLEHFAVFEDEPTNYQRTIYAFVDLTCPHCREFHLTGMKKWIGQGIRWVYIPFLRSPDDQKARKLAEYAFCARTNDSKKQFIDKIYLQGPKASLADIGDDDVTCDAMQSAMLDFTLMNGIRFNLKGSPMFLTESGRIYYGLPSLLRNELTN